MDLQSTVALSILPGISRIRAAAVFKDLRESAGTDGLALFWDGDDDFDFTVVVIAIDEAGNESAPRTVHITNGAGGCSVGHRRASDGFALAVLALALARGWRASRRART